MNGIELNFYIAYSATLLMLVLTIAAASVYAWWGWKNRDWLFRSRR